MEDKIEETLELNQETYDKLVALAKENNQTIDDTVNDILKKFISKFMTVKDFIKFLEDVENGIKIFDKNYFIIGDNGDIVAVCEPYNEKSIKEKE
jgi:hypothetical protein